MNINLIYPLIPSPLDRHIPGTDITAYQLLSDLSNQIKVQLQQSTKDTPFATINIMTAYIEDLIRKLKHQARTQPASANLNILLQLGASAQDDRWHTASGFTVTSQPNNPQSDQLADLLIRQAFRVSNLRKLVERNPNDPKIADEFRRWVYAGDKKLPGLIKRREQEIKLYYS